MCFWNKDKPRTLHQSAHYLLTGRRYFNLKIAEPSILELTITTNGGFCSLEVQNKETNEAIFFEENVPSKIVEIKLVPGHYVACLKSVHHKGAYKVRLIKEKQ